jgi:hypothetical protein
MRLRLGLRLQILCLCLSLVASVSGKALLLRGCLGILLRLLLLVVKVELLLASTLGLLMEMWIREGLMSLSVFNRGLRLVTLEKPLH